MSDGYERGVVVDAEGFYVTALKWRTGTPAPKLTKKATAGATPKMKLLRDEYAIRTPGAGLRWDFTPVREPVDPAVPTGEKRLVRSGTWQRPTDKRWVVVQRRDIPDIWSLTGVQMVWPGREPIMRDGVKLVAVEPPEVGRGESPVWDDSAGEWRVPQSVAVLDNSGAVTNFVVTYRDDDRPAGVAFVPVRGLPMAQDEAGRTVSVRKGDTVSLADDGSVQSVSAGIPNYRKFPVRVLEAVLDDLNLKSQFAAFVTGKGRTIADVRRLGEISLRNALLREFLEGEGYTMAAAWSAVQLAAEDAANQERETLAALSMEGG